jgi:hypothetical protein
VRAPLALAAILAGVSPAAAQVVSERPDKVAVVLYQDRDPSDARLDYEGPGGIFFDDLGLAVVSEIRTVDLPAGRSRLRFRGVSDGMVPQTAALEGLEGRLIERNFDFELLTSGTLISRSIGRPARLVRTNRKTGEVTETPVTIRSAPEGIVLQHADGSAEALGCSGLPEKLVFDGIPPNLTDTPTLSADVETPRAGRYVLKLSYLATDLHWKASYVARLDPARNVLDLQGWLTLSNTGGTTFGDAPTQVVAGRLERDGDDGWVPADGSGEARACWPAPSYISRPEPVAEARNFVSASPIATLSDSGLQEVVVTGSRVTASNIGDYKLYSLNEPTTVAAKQTKQVAFLAQTSVPYRRVYAFRAQPEYQNLSDEDRVQPAPVVLRLQNKTEAGLGKPLPGGSVTVLEPKSDGSPSLAGEARLRDTPVGLPADLEIDPSNLVTVEPTQGALSHFKRAGREFDRSAVTLTVRNAGRDPAPVEIRLNQARWKIQGESRPHATDGGFALWTLQVPAGGEATLSYRGEER